ncbi:MAG: hypothetical protein CMO26_11835 [Thiotrichales bacterium]|nr:hypothetical protein [Thiotrichales bacterium]
MSPVSRAGGRMPSQLELKMPRRIGVVLLPGYSITTLGEISETFRLANQLGKAALYAPATYAPDDNAGLSAQGIRLHIDRSLTNKDRLHIVVVMGHAETVTDELRSWLRRQAARCRLIYGVDGGAELLETLGVESDVPKQQLSGYPGEHTHWLCRVLAQDHGAELARRVEEASSRLGNPRPADAARIALLARLSERSTRLADAVRLMQANVETPLKLAEIARRVSLSMRQLERLFATHLECSPHSYYLLVRLEYADFLLRHSHCPVQKIALAIGFQSVNYFSRRYRMQFGVTPRAVREGGGQFASRDQATALLTKLKP